jgi:hypothetical protein
MSDFVKLGSDIPHVSLRSVDDLVGRIEALVADANAQGSTWDQEQDDATRWQ